MANRYEMRFGGSGGQGIMLIGDIMAEAIGIRSSKEVLLTKSYGLEARGSACRSELAVSDETISYPVITRPDFLLAMTQLSCDEYSKDLNKDGVMIVDSGFVGNVPKVDGSVYQIPLTQISIDTVGNALNANIVALGSISVLAKNVTVEGVRQCIIEHFNLSIREDNEKAFNEGVKVAQMLL